MSVNKVILVGRLGKDPELRYTTSGTPVANFTMATSERFKDRNGDQQEKTEWHNIVVWRNLAEICGKFLKKGKQIYIEGKNPDPLLRRPRRQQALHHRDCPRPDADARPRR